jgi:4-alpha-glucanotransferase
VDWLREAGMTLWQILPLVPPGGGNSPYSSASALSGNPWLIDLEELVEDGLLAPGELEAPPFPMDRVDFAAMEEHKGPLLERAADRLVSGGPGIRVALREGFEAFGRREAWALEAATFMVIRRLHSLRPWWEWPPALRDRRPDTISEVRRALSEEVERELALQFLFERQWQALRTHCRARGVRILGDVPIYVDRDSVDVWASRELFQLDGAGMPLAQAGVPPDYFSETGQLWGNPLYDWERMASDGYRWWVERMGRALAQVDLVRLDHFRGFSAFWSVPADAPDARGGEWARGPGRALFDALRAALGELPLVAEDLGVIDDEVVELRSSLGLPGMRVLQFAFGSGGDHPFLPHNFERHSLVYTGTHDNDTTLGWWLSAPEHLRDHVRRYLARDGHDLVWDLIRLAFASVADTAVVPLQDVLTLGADARMNRPSVAEGNWGWRVREEAFHGGIAPRLRELCWLYGREPRHEGGVSTEE